MTTADAERRRRAGGRSGKDGRVGDIRKGKPGGKLVFQAYADWGGTVLVKTANLGIHQGASLTHSGLYQMRAGRPGVDRALDRGRARPRDGDAGGAAGPGDVHRQDAARTPSSRTAGRSPRKTSSTPTTATPSRADSAYKARWSWLDKVEAVDAATVRFKTKGPFADLLGALATRQ